MEITIVLLTIQKYYDAPIDKMWYTNIKGDDDENSCLIALNYFIP